MNTSTRALWYRHWVELRWTFVPLSILYLFVLGTNSANALRWDVWFALPMHPFGPELSMTPLGEAIGDQLTVWAAFAGRAPWFGFMTAWVLAGSGVQNLFHPGSSTNAMTVQTLTLPVSRTRMALTRYFAALFLVLVLGMIASALGVGYFLLRGEAVPMLPVAQSLALGFLVSATILAVGSALTSAMPRAFLKRSLLHVVLFLLALVPVHYLAASPARGATPWDLVAGFLVLTGVCLAVTAVELSRKEY